MDNKYWVHVQCASCGLFNLIKGTKKNHGSQTHGVKCQYCDKSTWIQQSTISPRTFDIERAKRKEAQVMKQIKTQTSKI
jgi:hypothetical protein